MAYTYMLKKYNEDRDKHNAIVTKLKKAKEELKRINKENMELWKCCMKLEEDANKCFLTNVDGKIMNKTTMSKAKMPKLLIDISSHSAMFPAVDFTQITEDESDKIIEIRKSIFSMNKLIEDESKKTDQVIKANNYKIKKITEISELFKDCFEVTTKHFQRKQSKLPDVLSDNSVIFNTHHNNTIPTTKKALPEVAERETKGIIYSAISKLLSENKSSPIKSLRVSWDEFKDYNSMQVIGLMLLKKEKINGVISELFPSAFP